MKLVLFASGVVAQSLKIDNGASFAKFRCHKVLGFKLLAESDLSRLNLPRERSVVTSEAQ
jgi:hypothetical protein